MKTISFKNIIELISDILSISSRDMYYSNKNPYFEWNELLVEKLFEEVYHKVNIGYSSNIFSEHQIDKMNPKLSSYHLDRLNQSSLAYSFPQRIEEEQKEIRKKLDAYIERDKAINKLKNRFFSTSKELIKAFGKIEGPKEKHILSKPENNNWEKETFKIWLYDILKKTKNGEQQNTTDDSRIEIAIEEKYFNEIKIIFPFLQTKDEQSNLKYKTILNTSIFEKVFADTHSDISLDRINKSLQHFLQSDVPNETKHKYIHMIGYSIAPLEISENDELIGIIFALKKSFKKDNLIKTKNGIYYLNIGNGILAKFHTRQNKENLESDVAFITVRRERYRSSSIFSGYSSSGFILNNGLYIITPDLIFEIYFDASPYLLSFSENQAMVQNIGNSKAIDEEEQKRLDEL